MKACIKISSIFQFITQWVASPGTQNLLAVICYVVLVATSGFQIYIFTYHSLSSTFIIPLHRYCKNLRVVYCFLALGFFAIIVVGLITYLNILFTLHLMDTLLLPPSLFPSIRVFSNESVLRIRWSRIGASASVLLMYIQA